MKLNPVNTRRYLDVDSTFFLTSDGRQNNVVYIKPVNTRRYLDVDSTNFERQTDVKITLCALNLLTQDVIWTSIQRILNVSRTSK